MVFVSSEFVTDSTTVNHHFSPPFGEDFVYFFQDSNHRTSKSNLGRQHDVGVSLQVLETKMSAVQSNVAPLPKLQMDPFEVLLKGMEVGCG